MVNRDEAFPNQLEQILAKREPERLVHGINAAVQGYSTRQELVTIERSLKFEPDIVLVGVRLNDFTEPFTVDPKLGGTGLDYHLVRQTGNVFLSYLLHETEFSSLRRPQLEGIFSFSIGIRRPATSRAVASAHSASGNIRRTIDPDVRRFTTES